MAAKPLSMKKIKQMWKAFCVEQNANYVANRCRVHYRTAEKYIYRGDEKRGVQPFFHRFAEIQKEAAKKEDYDLAKATKQTLVLLRAYKAKLAEKLKSLDPAKIPDELSAAIERVLKAEQLLLGGPTDRTQNDGRVRFTYEEMIADINRRKKEREEADKKGEVVEWNPDHQNLRR